MTEYDSPSRKLPFPLRNALVFSRTTEEDTDCETVSSFVWPVDSDERVLVPFFLSLNEYNVLASAIDVGSDIAYGEDALRVVWLWLRNMRCDVSICDAILACIQSNPEISHQIGLKLLGSASFMGNMLEYMSLELPADVNFIRRMSNELLSYQDFIDAIYRGLPPNGATSNEYPPVPSGDTAICNAAAYIVQQIRDLIVDIFAQLATIGPAEVLASLLNQGGWSTANIYTLITTSYANLANETAILAAFDAQSNALKCRLNRGSLDQAYILAWIDVTYASDPILRDMLKYSISGAYGDGRYALWVTLGALQVGADCSSCDEVPNIRLVVRAGYNVAGLEFIENVGANSKYRVTKYPDGFNYVSMVIDSVGAIPFYITDVDIIDGANWNTIATGNRIIWANGSYAANTLPCYLSDDELIIEGLATGDTIEIIVSANPCPVWSIVTWISGPFGSIVSQNATQVVVSSTNSGFGHRGFWLEMQYGLKFRLDDLGYPDGGITNVSYTNASGENVPGFPPAGTLIRSLFAFNGTMDFTATLTGEIVP